MTDMPLTRIVGALLLAAISQTASAQAGAAAAKPGVVRIVIETERGDIAVSLDSARAPISVANFLRYVDGGYYAGGVFHRTVTAGNQPTDSVRIEVIQGGPNPQPKGPGFPPVELERTNVTGLKHVDGTISMARAGPNTATSDFFICVGDQPALDFGGHRNRDGQGFAAFGQVTSGMNVVRAIQTSAAVGQRLAPPVVIRAIRRVR